MKKSIRLHMKRFAVCALCIFPYGHFSFVLHWWVEYVTIKLYQLSERPSRILEMLQVLQGSHTVGYTEDRARYLNMLPGLANGTLNSSIHSRRVTSSALFSFDPCLEKILDSESFPDLPLCDHWQSHRASRQNQESLSCPLGTLEDGPWQ